jgi:hypothetical protein
MASTGSSARVSTLETPDDFSARVGRAPSPSDLSDEEWPVLLEQFARIADT